MKFVKSTKKIFTWKAQNHKEYNNLLSRNHKIICLFWFPKIYFAYIIPVVLEKQFYDWKTSSFHKKWLESWIYIYLWAANLSLSTFLFRKNIVKKYFMILKSPRGYKKFAIDPFKINAKICCDGEAFLW